ncbi:MAG TPA: AbrB family transcriptional regulator [Nostocaceae cyanobacterium]|nr:AbrB family transcriptional regulator [Nostocaceae cyanobacterium]
MNQSIGIVPGQGKKIIDNQVVTELQPSMNPLLILSGEFLLSFPIGLALAGFGLGGIAWIFAGIVAGVLVLQACRIFYQVQSHPNRTARKVGMALVGLTVGVANAPDHLGNMTGYIPILALMTCFLLLCNVGVGYLYSRLTKTNVITALLATVPGGVGVMSAIAADYNKNVALVALVQALRVTSVVFLIPLIVKTSVGYSWNQGLQNLGRNLISFEPGQLGSLTLVLIVTVIVIYLVKRWKIPAGEFVVTLFLGIAINPLLTTLPFSHSWHFTPPLLVNVIGQLLLGITIGEHWGDKPSFGKKSLAYALLPVAMTLGVGAIAATLAMSLTGWDWLTCLLVTAPGGSAEMILVALSLNHNVEIVTTGHVIRLLAINSSIPLWLFLFRRLDDQSTDSVLQQGTGNS